MTKSDKQQVADDFERTFGVSAKDLAADHEHQRRLVDMAAEAERLQATNAGSTTERYHQLRTGAVPAQEQQTQPAQVPAES